MNTKSVAATQGPQTIHRKIGNIIIEATAFGDGRVGVLVWGPPTALTNLAVGLEIAGWLVEWDEHEPGTLYAEGRGEEPKQVVEVTAEAPLELELDEEPPPSTLRCPPRASDLAATGGRA